VSDTLRWLDHTAFAVWVANSTSLWAFPTILLLHTFGLALVVGSSYVVSLRLLGIAATIPLPPLAIVFRFLWSGFVLSAASGAALFVSDATAKAANPYFQTKMVFILAATAIMVLLNRDAAFAPAAAEYRPSTRTRLLAGSAIVLWTVALTAGRLIAYLPPS
jgi:hypothetical protein